MRVTIEVGDGQDLCYLLDREIEAKRASRDILAAMPAEQTMSSGSHSYGESVKWCEEDIATYTEILESLVQALDFERLQTGYLLDHDNEESKEGTPRRRRTALTDH
jgi:hypothetical protein